MRSFLWDRHFAKASLSTITLFMNGSNRFGPSPRRTASSELAVAVGGTAPTPSTNSGQSSTTADPTDCGNKRLDV